MKKVSIIMPCYNDGAYIYEAVESVFAQTYTDIELIIVDDGSDDSNTISALQSLSAQSNTKVIHTEHVRPAGARNAGIEVATGAYILPLDSDDRIEPDYIEKAVAIMDSKEQIGVVYCHADLFGEQTGPWELPDYSFQAMLLDNIVFVTALFRREDWVKVGGFRTTMTHGMEDYDFWLSILELGREIYQLPEVLFHYRIKPSSRTTSFMENSSVVQETYRMLYLQHPSFYEKHQKEYALVLRDALVDQILLNRAYQKSIGVLNKLKKIPIVKQLVRKMILK